MAVRRTTDLRITLRKESRLHLLPRTDVEELFNETEEENPVFACSTRVR